MRQDSLSSPWLVVLLLLASIGLAAAPRIGTTPPRAGAQRQAREFTQLLRGLEAESAGIVESLSGEPEIPAGAGSFERLAARLARLHQPGEGEPALSVWSAAGEPLAWAGPADPPREMRLRGGPRFEARPIGARVHFLARVDGPGGGTTIAERSFGPDSIWTPSLGDPPDSQRIRYQSDVFSAAGAQPAHQDGVPLAAPDGRVLGWIRSTDDTGASGGATGRVGAILRLALTVALALILLRRRASPQRGSSLAGAELLLRSIGVWIVRSLASPNAPAALARAASGLADPSLYASISPLGLYRSPAAALLTGLALLAQSVLLVRALPPAGRAAGLWRGIAGVAGGLLLALASAFALRAGADSQMNLIRVGAGAHVAARSATQIGLFLTILSPGVLLLGALRPRPIRPLPDILLASPAASVLLFCALTSASMTVQRDLLVRNIRPQVLSQTRERAAALADSRRALERDVDLPVALDHSLSSARGDDLAYRLWARTDLARLAYRSSLDVHGPDGRLRGHFGVQMPPPVPPAAADAENLEAVDLAEVRFSTLSQEQRVLTTRWPVIEGDRLLGAVALYVSDEFDNLPTLLPPSPSWFATSPGYTSPAASEILEGEPLAVVYDLQGRLLWSARPDPPALRLGMGAARTPATGVWVDGRSGGHSVRMLYFGDGRLLYGIGLHRDGVPGHLGRMLRLTLFLLGATAAILLAATLLATPIRGSAPRLREALGALRASYAWKLVAAVLLASLGPLLVLALVLRSSLERQREESIASLGLQTLGVAERVVRDAVAASERGGRSVALLPGDETLFWLSRVLRQDIDLYADGMLVGTSRRGLYTAGLLPSLPDANAWRGLVLEGEHAILRPGPGEDASVTISGPVDFGGARPAVVSLPLDLQEAEVARRIGEVRELTDLASAAVALLLLGTSVLLGRGMSARLTRLTTATGRLASGDDVVEVAAGPPDEIGRLTESFNSMAQTLASQRATLRRRTETLEKILLHAPTGIVAVDEKGRVGMANPAATRILGAQGPVAPLTPLPEMLTGSRYGQELLDLTRAAGPAPGGAPREAELAPEGGGEGRLRAILADLPSPSGGYLLILEDITESVRSNRLAAWAEMARTIAHEIKNPLTPIRLSAEHLRRVHERGDPRLGETLVSSIETILKQVRALREIASDFSLYARMPSLTRTPVSASAFFTDVIEPYVSAPPTGVEIGVDLPADLPVLNLDARLIRRALVNLIENALQAMPEGGRLTLSARALRNGRLGVLVRVADTGVGMDDEIRRHLFEPYFSTRSTGTGLGLAIARRAIEEHGGTIEIDSEPGRGTMITVTLPAERTA